MRNKSTLSRMSFSKLTRKAYEQLMSMSVCNGTKTPR